MASTYLKLFGVVFFWGGTFVAGRWLAGSVSPYASAFFRFAVASLLLLALTWKTEKRLPRVNGRQLLVLAALGASGICAYNLFFFNGLALISAGRASLIIALNPVFITLLASVVHREPLPWSRGLGILLSVTGAIVVITRGHPAQILAGNVGRGELLIFGCVLSWTLYSVIGQTAMRGLSPLTAVCYSSLAGTVLLAIPAALHGAFREGLRIPPMGWISIGYLGLFGTVIGFYWYFQAIATIGPSRAGVFINFVPVNALLLSSLVLKEPLTASLLVGAPLVITGSWLANATGFRKNPSTPCKPTT